MRQEPRHRPVLYARVHTPRPAGCIIWDTFMKDEKAIDEESPLAPNERGTTPVAGDPNYLCLWNNSNKVYLYVSLRFDTGGLSNLALQPLSSQRIYTGLDGDGDLCWSYGQQIKGTECPNQRRISSWAGNCP